MIEFTDTYCHALDKLVASIGKVAPKRVALEQENTKPSFLRVHPCTDA